MAAGDEFARAHRELLADPSVQFSLPPTPPPPKPPAWMKTLGEWLEWIGKPIGRFFRWLDSFLPDAPYAKIILWTAIVVIAAGFLWMLVTWLRTGEWRWPWQRRTEAVEIAEEEEWRPDAAPLRAWLEEADALAASGQFAEAVHHLLFRSVEDIAKRRPALVQPSATSRELASAEAIPAGARGLFGRIAGIVERGLFARRPVNEADWNDARSAYAEFALAGAWRG